jgi:DNA-binding beta-propeller fold protein YncE
VVFSYSSDVLRCPTDVAVDVQGNMYAIGQESNNLHRISPNGKSMGIMLSKSDGLSRPCSITFNKKYSKLYIFNFGYQQILTFFCQLLDHSYNCYK